MKYHISGDGWDQEFEAQSGPLGREWQIVDPDGGEHSIDVEELEEGVLRLTCGDATHVLTILPGNRPGETLRFLLDDRPIELNVEDEVDLLQAKLGDGGAAGGRREIRSVMPGIIRGLLAAEGDTVEVDSPLLLLEAMKMENEIRATGDGIVSAVHVQPGQTVNGGDVLVEIEEPED